MADPKSKFDPSLFDEDDEFEEFPTEDWEEEAEDPADKQLWEDNWDDDKVEDDFSMQLRAELERAGHIPKQ